VNIPKERKGLKKQWGIQKGAQILAPFRTFHSSKSDIHELGYLSKWLFASRSIILIISMQAAVISGLLTILYGGFHLFYFILVLIGFVTAHAVSNLMNDYFGYRRGHDMIESPRLKYTVHPIADKVASKKELLQVILVLMAAGLLIAGYLTMVRGYMTLIFLASGAFFLFMYDVSPMTLKSIGLGETAAFIVWGPLMIGSGYFIISGSLSLTPFLVSIPYGLGVMSILIGKHLDQIQFDHGIGQRTLPVILGEKNSRLLNISVILMMYLFTLFLAVFERAPFPLLIVFFNLPAGWSTVKTLYRAKPLEAPKGYIGWPLWYHRYSLKHVRSFGFLYMAGLASAAVLHLFIK
jgi:1,4-dihydroxy-2-naphthoate octaprenyltransferase